MSKYVTKLTLCHGKDLKIKVIPLISQSEKQISFPFYWDSFSKVSMTQSEKQIYFPFYWASFSKVL